MLIELVVNECFKVYRLVHPQLSSQSVWHVAQMLPSYYF